MSLTFGTGFGAIAVAIALSMVVPPCAYAENADGQKNPLVGTWELTSDWGKEGEKGKHIVSVNPDLTGTIKDLEQGWSSKLRNLEAKGDALSFSFFFGETEEYEMTFEGKVVSNWIKGEFSIFGTTAAVVGTALSAAEEEAAAARKSVFDIYEARSFTSSEGDTLPYRLFAPPDYNSDKQYPVILFHHGGGATGSDNRLNLEGACVREWIRPEVQAKNPCFIVAPQIPSRESQENKNLGGTVSERMKLRTRTIHEILDSLEEEFSIDKSREYVTGLSFGGECVWMSLVERPDRFAAAVPICATDWIAINMTSEERGKKFAQLPLWIFHGDADEKVPVEASRKMVKALRDSGGNPKYTEYPGVNHNSWDQAYRDPELVEWLFAQNRRADEDPRKREPQLSADQEEYPLTDITETTDAKGVIWGKGMHNGILREWRLQIPPTNHKPVPLYAYFHGAAGWMTKFDEFNGILATSNERILLIGKGGMPEFDRDRNRDDFSWNAANDPKHPRDLDFARKLILYVQKTYNVDKSRVYAAGYSGGSFMAQAMAAVHSDLFAASVSWAGYLTYRESTFPEDFNYKPIPILQMHSTDDPLVKYEPYKPDPALIGAMPNFKLWLGHNGCDAADIPEGKPNPNGFIEFVGENCDAPVVHWQYNNYGHGGGNTALAFEWVLQFTKQQDSASQIDSPRDVVKPAVETKAKIAFEPADFRETTYDGWIADRMKINVEKRLLKLDLDMILEPFANRPGPQWWAGEHVGKYLHAATYAWRFTGDDRLKERMDYAVKSLVATQLANGYLGTYKESDQFGQGDGLGWDGPVWDVWTHKYNLIGLLTYYQATGNESALEASKRAADLMYETLVVKKRSMRLASAHMGMAATSVLQPMAFLYRLTGEQRYLDFCHYVIESWEEENKAETWMYEDGCQLLTSLLEHGNVYKTANRKAYEMLSNLVGLLELYRVEPDERYLTACKNAWKDIATKRLYITGTASYHEQFTPDHRLPPGEATGEGCVTVTWLQLTTHLLELTGQVQYADELERTVYNALLAAQSPHTGEVAYFVPLIGQRWYGDRDRKMDPEITCCASSIPRGIAMIPRFASGTLNGKPALLQYIPGKHALHYGVGENRKNVTLHIRGDYPETGDLDIEVELEETTKFPLVLRVPAWAKGFEVTVGGKTYRPSRKRLLEIRRKWSPGDMIHVKIPIAIRVIPDGDKTTDSVAFARGPQVLATDTIIDASGGIPATGWWGDNLYTCTVKQNGVEKEFRLVSFADAGQNKQEYTVLHEGIESPESEPEVLFEK